MADKTELLQAIDDAILDADSLEKFVNGSDSETVLTRLSAEYPTLQNAISQINGKLDSADAQIKQSITTLFENGGLPATPFKTKALMEASELPDGGYAMVTDDNLNNGFYIKSNSEWVRSEYNPAENALEMLKGYINTGYNELLDFKTVNGYFKWEELEREYFLTASGVAKSQVFKVDSSTEYTILVNSTGRQFRVIEFTEFPKVGVTNGVAVKVTTTPAHKFHRDSNGFTTKAYTLTTRPETTYMVVSAQAIAEEVAEVQVKKGGVFDWEGSVLKTDRDVVYKDYRLSDLSRVVQGKNLFNGEYIQAGIFGGVSGEYSNTFRGIPEGLRTAVVEVEPNTQYTISKESSSRFRVAVSNLKPKIGATYLKRITEDSEDTKTSITVTTGDRDYYLLVYVSATSQEPFMQIEKGSEATSWETYGYKLSKKAERYAGDDEPVDELVPPKGDANFFERGEVGIYTNSSKLNLATDDTKALQDIFDRGGVVHLDGRKVYRVTDTLNIDLSKVSAVHGHGVTIVTDVDKPVLNIFGGLVGSSNPNNRSHLSLLKVHKQVEGIRVTSSRGDIGTGIVVSGAFKLDLKCHAYLLKEGIVIQGTNRNLQINSTVYAVTTNCLRFAPTCNLHQCQVYACDMSYANKVIFFDDPEIYNMQIFGGDLEVNRFSVVGSDDIIPEHIIHMKSVTNRIVDVSFNALTIEAHGRPSSIVKIEAETFGSIVAILFSGCFLGVASSYILDLSNVKNFKYEGHCSRYGNSAFRFGGDLKNIKIDACIFSGDEIPADASNGGTIVSIGDFLIEDVSINVISSGSKRNHMLFDCNIDGLLINDCIFKAYTYNHRFNNSKGMIDIQTINRTVENVQICNNIFKLPAPVSDVIKIGTPTGRVRVQNNDSNVSGSFPASTAKVESSGNCSP